MNTVESSQSAVNYILAPIGILSAIDQARTGCELRFPFIIGIGARDDPISIQTSYRSAEAPHLSHGVKLHVVLDTNRTGGVCVQGGQFGIKHQVLVALPTCE